MNDLIIPLFVSGIILLKYFKYKQKINFYEEKLKTQRECFIEVLNHDIRIPTLAQLRGLEVLKKEQGEDFSNEKRDIFLQIENSCKYTLNMISMLINTYRIENKTRTLIYEKFNLAEILFDCFEELSTSAKEKSVTFSYISTGSDTQVEADKTELKNVIYNLLLGAINYSRFGEEIKVKIDIEKKHIIFSILNSEFAKTLQARNSKEKFTTVGHNVEMLLCEKIIECHKGNLFIKTGRNKDSAFAFKIPRCSALYN